MEETKKKNGGLVVACVLLILLVCGLSAYVGFQYATYEKKELNEKETKENQEETKKEITEEGKTSFALDIYKECGDKACEKNFEETVNGKKYTIHVVLNNRENLGTDQISGMVQINDFQEKFYEVDTLSEIGILPNGMIAIRTIPSYVGNARTYYYDNQQLVETIYNNSLENYPIDQMYGVYDDCKSDEENLDDGDFNQTALLYSFSIDEKKEFHKTEIGSFGHTFCSAQS